MDLEQLAKTLAECNEIINPINKKYADIEIEKRQLVNRIAEYTKTIEEARERFGELEQETPKVDKQLLDTIQLYMTLNARNVIISELKKETVSQSVITMCEDLNDKLEKGIGLFENYETFMEIGNKIIDKKNMDKNNKKKKKKAKAFLSIITELREEFFQGSDKK